jgi:hypothetical protein
MSQQSSLNSERSTSHKSKTLWGRIAGVAASAALCMGLNIPTSAIAGRNITSATLDALLTSSPNPPLTFPFVHDTVSAPLIGTWLPKTFNFTAGGASTTLAFKSTTTTPQAAAGPQIDNVIVECVPPQPPQGQLKVCKVAGPFVPVGTHFTFHAGTAAPFTVLAGPAPGGTCSLGPTFNAGWTVSVTETVPSGMTVSTITVAPPPRLVGTPNLPGGTVQVMIGSGVTDVTFTNRRQTGYLEICKRITPQFFGAGNYSFFVNPGNLGPFVGPARSCSPAIEVAAGMVTITELPSPGTQLAGCSTLPTTQQGPCNLAARTSTVNVAPGDVSTQTIAIFTNSFVHHLESTVDEEERQ